MISGLVHTLSDPKPEVVVEGTIWEAPLQTWLTRACAAASPFCVGCSRSPSLESTFGCLFLSGLKKGLNLTLSTWSVFVQAERL